MRQWTGGKQSRLTEFVAPLPEELGQHRGTDKEGKILSCAPLSAVAQVVKMIVSLAFEPQFGVEAIRKIVSFGIAMIEAV